jgi:hypothetical protein
MLVDWAPSEVEAPRRLCLSADEASFVQAAFERILPEAPHVSASTYVDRKLAESMCVDATAGELELYREAIACVQERCRFEHGRPFQALTPWHQLAILAHLEDPNRPFQHRLRKFVLVLVNDLAEAYFDASDERCRRLRVSVA